MWGWVKNFLERSRRDRSRFSPELIRQTGWARSIITRTDSTWGVLCCAIKSASYCFVVLYWYRIRVNIFFKGTVCLRWCCSHHQSTISRLAMLHPRTPQHSAMDWSISWLLVALRIFFIPVWLSLLAFLAIFGRRCHSFNSASRVQLFGFHPLAQWMAVSRRLFREISWHGDLWYHKLILENIGFWSCLGAGWCSQRD